FQRFFLRAVGDRLDDAVYAVGFEHGRKVAIEPRSLAASGSWQVALVSLSLRRMPEPNFVKQRRFDRIGSRLSPG
ncbi:MAG: hypothetical protein ABI831_01480, partial [Betaproteobacteria bacterium]